MRVLTLMMRVMTRLENASCAMGRTMKEPPIKMRANAPCLMLQTLHAQACHHLWGEHSPS
jgi:hypothetical protein